MPDSLLKSFCAYVEDHAGTNIISASEGNAIGSVLMHMGSLAVKASLGLNNFRHIVFNNGAHDSIGSQPTAAVSIPLSKVAASSGYKSVLSVDNEEDLLEAARKMAAGDIQFLEVRVRKGARKNLGRPMITPRDCKKDFMAMIV